MSSADRARGFLRHVHACNPPVTEPFVPWTIEKVTVGWMRPAAAARVLATGDAFRESGDGLALRSELCDFATRSEALAAVVRRLADAGLVPAVMGEPYPVTPGGRDEAFCVIDRAAAALFGVRSFGQHVNGYVRRDDGIHMWVGRRARDRLLFPGALDNMVAGGLPHDLELHENLVKECREEAGVTEELVRGAVPVGAISYNRVTDRGFRPDVLYCYDMALPDDFVPRNTDGEVEAFMLLPLSEVAGIVHDTDEFKLNCNLVVIDFLIRHGWLGPHSPDYLALVQGLRRPLSGAVNHGAGRG
jgi:8-oxo-dGTP pyrophosphatase MutT (NUDIX family)